MGERIDYEQSAPRGVKALNGVHFYVSQAGFSPVLLTLVYLRVSLINGCAYCIDMHSRELRALGVPNEKIALVPVFAEAAELFDARERAALAWAETVTRISATGAPDSVYEQAAAQFDDKELVDLSLAIGLMNAYNRLAISFRRRPVAVDTKSPEVQPD